MLYNLQTIIVNNSGYKKKSKLYCLTFLSQQLNTHLHQGKHLSQEGFDQGDLEKFQVVA